MVGREKTVDIEEVINIEGTVDIEVLLDIKNLIIICYTYYYLYKQTAHCFMTWFALTITKNKQTTISIKNKAKS